jgi:hypothetical protein
VGFRISVEECHSDSSSTRHAPRLPMKFSGGSGRTGSKGGKHAKVACNLCTYNMVVTRLYFNRLTLRIENPAGVSSGRTPICRMPFAEAETALASMIGWRLAPESVREKIRAPAARQVGSTTFQQLTRRLNDLAFSPRSFRTGLPIFHVAIGLVILRFAQDDKP